MLRLNLCSIHIQCYSDFPSYYILPLLLIMVGKTLRCSDFPSKPNDLKANQSGLYILSLIQQNVRNAHPRLPEDLIILLISDYFKDK